MRKPRRRAISLVELIVCMFILAILLAVGVPVYRRHLANETLKTDVDQLVAALKATQHFAASGDLSLLKKAETPLGRELLDASLIISDTDNSDNIQVLPNGNSNTSNPSQGSGNNQNTVFIGGGGHGAGSTSGDQQGNDTLSATSAATIKVCVLLGQTATIKEKLFMGSGESVKILNGAPNDGTVEMGPNGAELLVVPKTGGAQSRVIVFASNGQLNPAHSPPVSVTIENAFKADTIQVTPQGGVSVSEVNR